MDKAKNIFLGIAAAIAAVVLCILVGFLNSAIEIAFIVLVIALAVFMWTGWFNLSARFPRHKAIARGLAISAFLSLPSCLMRQSEEHSKEVAALRTTNPDAYLAIVKTENGDNAWLQELKQLKPQAYEQEMAARKARVAAEVSRLLNELQNLPASDYKANAEHYKRLAELDPQNKDYKDKLAYFSGEASQQEGWEDNPGSALKIVHWNWHKGGFDTVMIASFTIKNNAGFDIKDPTIYCVHSSNSGTVIDENTQTVYEVFLAGKSRTIHDVNMGFIHSQATHSNCEITTAARR